jgi:hypothetical protein
MGVHNFLEKIVRQWAAAAEQLINKGMAQFLIVGAKNGWKGERKGE